MMSSVVVGSPRKRITNGHVDMKATVIQIEKQNTFLALPLCWLLLLVETAILVDHLFRK